jgi:hypothetical protein
MDLRIDPAWLLKAGGWWEEATLKALPWRNLREKRKWLLREGNCMGLPVLRVAIPVTAKSFH